MKNTINILDEALMGRSESPAGVMVRKDVFVELMQCGRLTKKRVIPDLGFDFWALDDSIFVWVDLDLQEPYKLPE